MLNSCTVAIAKDDLISYTLWEKLSPFETHTEMLMSLHKIDRSNSRGKLLKSNLLRISTLS